MTETMRIGAGAGYAGDRWEPAIELAEKGDLDFLAFECLAERTIAHAAHDRARDPERGFNPQLAERMAAVLPACRTNRVRVISNMGAANPEAAGRCIAAVGGELGLADLKVAVVTGDDVRAIIAGLPGLRLMETGEPLESILPRMESANAYLGADCILAALQTGAEVVITGRVADPSLFVAPMLYKFGWSYDDYDRLAAATAAGHLLECAGQLTGGYFADPGKKDVADMARLGFPLAEVSDDGSVIVTKVAGSGGHVDRMTCTEQLLYEVHDPAAYITPDCVLDITDIELEPDGRDRVRLSGAKAAPRTDTYKVSVGYFDGFIGEGEISYAGPNAVARARLAGEIVRERLKLRGFAYDELRIELIGMESLHGAPGSRPEPYEVRLRAAGRSPDRKTADAVGHELETLYTNGPAGGAGAVKSVREILAVQSVLLPRTYVSPQVAITEPH